MTDRERAVHVVLPHDIDDPAIPSGGNTYDRRICHGLAGLGWSVREHTVPGGWPRAGPAGRAGLSRLLQGLPDNTVVLLDGLVASAAPEILVPLAGRLALVVLVHMPLADDAEAAALSAARAVVATSAWARRRLLELYPVPAHRVHVATPGVDPARLATGSGSGTRLLCVAAVARHKGHDLLAEALAKVSDLPWSCTCVGALDRDRQAVARLREQVEAYGMADRMRLVNPRSAAALDARYAAADLLVLPSRAETYGMVVTEALARGIPVLTTAAGGLPEALGRTPEGDLPGILVEPDDPAALAGALRRWLTDVQLRRVLRRCARARRDTLTGWPVTAELISKILDAHRRRPTKESS